jgi:hypothetical protein
LDRFGGFFVVFFTTRYRSGRCRCIPFCQPGDFPRVCGIRVGEPISTKRLPRRHWTREGVGSDRGFCQGRGASVTRERARKSSHWANVTKVVQRSPASWVRTCGSVQPRSCFLHRILGSMPQRNGYVRQSVSPVRSEGSPVRSEGFPVRSEGSPVRPLTVGSFQANQSGSGSFSRSVWVCTRNTSKEVSAAAFA